jgi:hypothetical protein
MLLNLLYGLSPVQWIFIGVGLLIMLPTLVGWLGKAKVLALDSSVSKPASVVPDSGHKLTDIVCKWECLYEACQAAHLEIACSKIEEVFPLLTKKSTPEEKA